MGLHNLVSIAEKRKRRLGQGHGSGRVKTAGRGTKGKKARGSVPLAFEGGALPLVKRMPFLRGKGRNRSLKAKPALVNLSALRALPANATVDIATLVKFNIINENEVKQAGVKILGKGEVVTPLMIALPISKRAAKQIEKAGGTIQKAA